MKERIIKFVLEKAKRNKLVQSIFEQPIELDKLPVFDTFRDAFGNEHKLHQGFRSKIRPGWELIFQQDDRKMDMSPGRISQIVVNGKIAINRLLPIVNLYLPSLAKARVLEIGCSAGGAVYTLAEKRPLEVVGTEFSGYKVEALDNAQGEKQDVLNEVNSSLRELREKVGARFMNNTTPVTFLDDDICNTKLPTNTFDLICSWDVLEHLHNPLAALKCMSNLLSDDGIAVHEYNPFFSLAGGHSASSIDFPWGHVILNDEDFLRFNLEKQPDKLKTAISFYKNGLNRMTIRDLENHCSEANMEIVSMIKFPKEQHLRMMDKNILERCKLNYPTMELDDLITPRIIVILRKKQSR